MQQFSVPRKRNSTRFPENPARQTKGGAECFVVRLCLFLFRAHTAVGRYRVGSGLPVRRGATVFPADACGPSAPLGATYSGSFFCCRPPWGIAVSFHRGVNRLFCSVPDKSDLLCLPDAASVPSRPAFCRFNRAVV